MDSLFERLPLQRKGERQRPAPPAPGTPLHVVLTRRLAGVISPPSPLALKRRERKAEREAAVKAAAREAKAVAREAKAAAKAEPSPSTEPDAIDKLVAAGITTPYLATLGSLKADDTPYSPRSIGFPVKVYVVGGPFGPKP